jgi:beta-glucanase (GH16 family)
MLSEVILGLLVSASVAWDAPQYSGFNKDWQDNFGGTSGTSPNTANWQIINNDNNANHEAEVYTSSEANVQLSGGSTLQLVPFWNGNQWTSGRIESNFVFTPAEGRITIAEALIRFGDDPNKQGIWPAFWLLGESLRYGTPWPACGEIDVLEMVNGALTGYGTVHCDVAPGGICHEYNGIGEGIGMPDLNWHAWRVQWDRTSGNWWYETITWFMDGQRFHQVSGSQIGDYNVWQSLAQTPLYFILNVAVGGDWVSLSNINPYVIP